MDILNAIKGTLFGVAVGDALGVPVEFKSRDYLKQFPVNDIIGHGTYNQPPGTFSDDSSLTFCLAEALTNGYDLTQISNNFLRWYKENYWTANGKVFDIGMATENALFNILDGVKPELAGGTNEWHNGNGSLMRISPLLFYIYKKPIQERFEIIKNVSSITHGHIRSIISCFYYLEYMLQLLNGSNNLIAYNNLKTLFLDFLNSISISQSELRNFDRLINYNIFELSENDIESSGYVINTLEASMWCFLRTESYQEAVIKAVNLGYDTDTTGCVTGGIAGLYYGIENIPKEWKNKILKCDEIEDLAERLYNKIVIEESI